MPVKIIEEIIARFENHPMYIQNFLFHLWGWNAGQDQMKVYLGPGIGLGFGSEFHVTIRAASGVGYYFHNIPLELHANIVPGLGVAGWNGVVNDPSFFIGGRWYF